MVKNPPANAGETGDTRDVGSSQEDPLEQEMATHSSILAWEIPWTGEPGRPYSPWGCKESDVTERLNNNSNKEPKSYMPWDMAKK